MALGTKAQVVKSVHDGDTYTIDYKIIKFQLRLRGVDCPEVKNKYSTTGNQQMGIEIRDSVSKLIKGKKVRLSQTSQDKYGRVLAKVTYGRKDLAKYIISKGWGWSTDPALLKYQKSAQKKKIGIWFYENPQNPADFRKK